MARWQTKVMVVVESMFRMDDDATTYCRIIWASVDRVVGIDDTSFSAGLGCHGCKCPRNRQTGHLERIEAETQGPSRPARARRGFGMTARFGGSGVLVNDRETGRFGQLGFFPAVAASTSHFLVGDEVGDKDESTEDIETPLLFRLQSRPLHRLPIEICLVHDLTERVQDFGA